MKITDIKINIVAEVKVKAYVSIVLDNCFLINGLRIIDRPAGLFVAMPGKKQKNGACQDIVHPLNRETREMIEDLILDEYERMLDRL